MTPTNSHDKRSLQDAAESDSEGPFDPGELVRWAETYGHPETWAKKAQQLHARVEAKERVIVVASEENGRLRAARDELLRELRRHAELHGQRGYGGDAERAWAIWRRLGGQ